MAGPINGKQLVVDSIKAKVVSHTRLLHVVKRCFTHAGLHVSSAQALWSTIYTITLDARKQGLRREHEHLK